MSTDFEKIDEMQRYAFQLKSEGKTLEEIVWEVNERYHEKKSISQISRWVSKAALKSIEDNDLMDLKVQRARGISELEDIERMARKALEDKKIEYEYVNRKGETIKEEKTLSPMIYNMFLTTLLNTVDKKNQLRGLHNAQTQVAILNQYNTNYNNLDDVAAEYQNMDPNTQQELQAILSESKQVATSRRKSAKSRIKTLVESSTVECEEDSE